MNNKKRYQKVFVNDNCIVDFTEQNIKATKVNSGNTFFDTNGRLIEGVDDTLLFLNGYMSGCYGLPTLAKSSVTIGQMSVVNSYCLSCCQSSLAPIAQYFVLSDELTSVYSSESASYDGLSLYIPHQTNLTTSSLISSFYKNLESCVTSSGSYPDLLVFCQDEIPDDSFPNRPDLLITGCSEIKTTENGVFDYVTAKDKAYIIAINAQEYIDSLIYHTNDTGDRVCQVSIPPVLDNLPVVGIGGNILSSVFSTNLNWCLGVYPPLYSQIVLPDTLEFIGADCFSGLYHSTCEKIKITLPESLKHIYGSHAAAGSYESSKEAFGANSSDCWDFKNSLDSETFYWPENLEAPPVVISNIVQGLNLSEETCYIPSKTNPYAVFTAPDTYSETNIVIQEGCKYLGRIPNNITQISLPSTLKSLPAFRGEYYNLNQITFSSTTVCKTVPSSFISYTSTLKSIILPEGIEKISRNAFDFCYINDYTLPSTLKYIDYYGLSDNYSAAAKTIRIKAKTPPTLYSTSSIQTYGDSHIAKIIVPKGCLAAYKAAANWKNYATKMEESTEW